MIDALSSEHRRLAKRARRPTWVKPMLATLTDQRDLTGDWVFERKYDGIRALAFIGNGDVRLLSRNRLDLADRFPTVVRSLQGRGIADAILDGEVVAVEGKRSTFEMLQQGKARVVFRAFDILHLDGFEVTALPLLARKELLASAVTPTRDIRLSPARGGSAERLLDDACGRGWEGLIAKRADARYVHGRSRDWLKLKCALEQEFVVGGFSDPRGARNGFGALLLGTYEGDGLRYAGEVGTGFKHETLRTLRARLDALEQDRSPFIDLDKRRAGIHWVKPKIVVQVGFTEWTRAGRLRHPRYLGERTDKTPREVVRERAS